MTGRRAAWLVDHSRLVLAVLLVATLVVGAGAPRIGQSASLDQFQAESVAADKQAYVEEHFATGQANRTTVQVVVRGENVLSKESLVASLELQRALAANETVAETLAPNGSTVGVANLVATAAIQQESRGGPSASSGSPPDGSSSPAAAATFERPSIDDQLAALRGMDDSEVAATVERVLAADAAGAVGPENPLSLLPTDYEPGTASADARLLLVFQTTEEPVGGLSDASDRLVRSQTVIQRLVDEQHGDDAFVFGLGIVSDEIGRSMGDTFAIISPLALLFVVATLAFAYRDLLDVVLGVLGIGLVMVWMAGFMGWAGIAFNQMLMAVPILLIGLGIDYGIHVFMRHREARADGSESRPAMRRALGGVGVALVLVTATTAFGFLSNLVSTVPPIRDFGLVSAAGIVSALVVFAGIVPAVKVELDGLLEGFGLDRRRRALGTRGGLVTRVLSVGTTLARRGPVVVLLVAAVLAAGGAYGATAVDTSFDQADFIAEDPPDWMDALGPLAPGEYTVRENLAFVDERFVQFRSTTQATVLVEGDVTAPDALERLQASRDLSAESPTTVVLANDEAKIDGPVSVMHAVAARNESFAAVISGADGDGDGVPDRDIEAVYDAFFAAAPDRAGEFVHRTDAGEYAAVRLVVYVTGDANVADVTADVQAATEPVDGDGLEATATGQPVLTAIVQDGLLRTMTETLVLTLVSVLALLVVVFRLWEGSASLGAVTVVPVLFALAWILGTMSVLDVPFNAETAMITSLAIGLGVDYSIHVSERFAQELDRLGSVDGALSATITGTGGALLGSAVTTASGFGVMGFALVPSLQRFGIVIATTIVFAFLAAVLVLPSLLVLWARTTGADA